MNELQSPRLSGDKYIKEYSYIKTKIGKWETDIGDDTFWFCKEKQCERENEHEYSFDGQVYFRKTEAQEYERNQKTV